MSNFSIKDLQRQYAGGALTVERAVRDCLDVIERHNKTYNIFIEKYADCALKRARELDAQKDKKGLLFGVPVAIKDNLCFEGFESTCGSKILKGYRAPYTATAVKRLIDEGGVVIGRVNMDEFAMGSSTETSYYGPALNPWNTACTPGGSSGGSAAAVAARMAPVSIGSDTGGSIRQPASLCGVVGIKPTYGRVSRYGLVAFASSLDQIGPFSNSVEDGARLLRVICGADPMDSTSAAMPVPDFEEALSKDIKGLRIGLPKEYFGAGLDPEVKDAVMKALAFYETQGAVVQEISLPHTEYAVAAYYIVATAEASSNLARYDGVQYGHAAKDAKNLLDLYKKTRSEGFGDEVKRRILLGTYVLSAGYYDAYYLKGQKVRTLIKQDFLDAFAKVDCIVTPTSPAPGIKIGEKTADPLTMYLSDIYTIAVNLAGLPGISIPCGISKAGLPIGLQVITKHFDEETMLKVAHKLEQTFPKDMFVPDLRKKAIGD